MVENRPTTKPTRKGRLFCVVWHRIDMCSKVVLTADMDKKKNKEQTTKMVSIRMPVALIERLDETAGRTGKSKTYLILEGVELQLLEDWGGY